MCEKLPSPITWDHDDTRGDSLTKTRLSAVAGTVLILIGLGLSFLSKQWIEDTLGFEPDGGNGALELAFVLVPIAIGASLLAIAALAHHQRRARQSIEEMVDNAG